MTNGDFNHLRSKLRDDDVETHAKWLFGSAAIVGTLGGAFQLLGDLTLPGRYALAGAVTFTGLSLALATFSLIPIIKRAETYEVEVLVKVSWWRRWSVRLAAVFFGIAIVLASLAPLVSLRFVSEPASVARVTHTLARDTLRARFQGSELPPHAVASLVVIGTQGTVASARALADSTGTLDLELPVVTLNPENSPFVVLGTWADPEGETVGADTVDVTAVAGPP
jgi:hypothetical protein